MQGGRAFAVGALGHEGAEVALIQRVEALEQVPGAELHQDAGFGTGLKMGRQGPLHQAGAAAVRVAVLRLGGMIDGVGLRQAREQLLHPLAAVPGDGGASLVEGLVRDREQEEVAGRAGLQGGARGGALKGHQGFDFGAGQGAGARGQHLLQQVAAGAEEFLIQSPEREVGTGGGGAVGGHPRLVVAVEEDHGVGMIAHEGVDLLVPVGRAHMGVDDPGGFGADLDGHRGQARRRHEAADLGGEGGNFPRMMALADQDIAAGGDGLGQDGRAGAGKAVRADGQRRRGLGQAFAEGDGGRGRRLGRRLGLRLGCRQAGDRQSHPFQTRHTPLLL
ncbi:hypothetical protein D3C80_1035630 [compost metagenome]